jgi:hypothetical protein
MDRLLRAAAAAMRVCADVCQRCGERLYPQDTVRRFWRVGRGMERRSLRILACEYEFQCKTRLAMPIDSILFICPICALVLGLLALQTQKKQHLLTRCMFPVATGLGGRPALRTALYSTRAKTGNARSPRREYQLGRETPSRTRRAILLCTFA